MPVEVIATDEFVAWYQGLDENTSDDVDVAVGVLESQGVALGAPRSSDIKGASFALRELRLQSMARPFRIFYAFDPRRQAVLLLGGDKTGDNRSYDVYVPIADRLFDEHLNELSTESENGEEVP